MRVRFMNAKPILKKDAVPNLFVDLEEQDSILRYQGLQEEGAMESSSQVRLKDSQISANILKKPCGSYCRKEDKQLGASYSCMLCERLFSSQVSLAAHFNSCITHLGYVHTSFTSKSADNCTERNGLGQLEPTKFYDCKMCSAKIGVKDTWENHQTKCENQFKQGKNDQNPVTSTLIEPEPPVFYYCNICFAGFDESHAWESHLAMCEYRPKQGKKDQNAVTSSFMKEPSKDILHEKVIEDESWLVTSPPEGYECVDAMFVVETEGTCMLQQEIPVEPEEEQLEFPEQKEHDDLVPDEGISHLDQDLLPPWSLGLEAEEEKEMMEQKLVLEPRLMQSVFVCVRGRPPDDFEEEVGEPLQDPLAFTEAAEVKERNKLLEEDPSSVADFISVKMEPEEVQIKVACH